MPKNALTSLWAQARRGEGLSSEKAARLWKGAQAHDWKEIFSIARDLTRRHFGRNLFFFAPLYFSSFCVNDCDYCGFRRSNAALQRKALTVEEFLREAKYLWEQGHRTLLLVGGEHPEHSNVERVKTYVEGLQKEGLPFSLTLEISPQSLEDYRRLKALGIRQCLLFQETYDFAVYHTIHHGPKRNFQWRHEAMFRAQEAGMERVGLGILLGLKNAQEDVLSLIQHAWEFKRRFGRFPATVSYPRLCPAEGVSFGAFLKIPDETYYQVLALTRLALPETGLILSTRESSGFRDRLLELGIGITHLSAGSSTVPGGYTLLHRDAAAGQFYLEDSRSLREVQASALSLGYTPQAVWNPVPAAL